MKNKFKKAAILAFISIFLLQTLAYSEEAVAPEVISPSSATMLTTQLGDVNMKISLIYDNSYHERILMPGKQLTAELDITNNTNQAKTINLIIALYDESSKLVEIKYFTNPLAGNKHDVFTGSTTVPVDSNVSSAKIMIWNDIQSMNPYGNSVVLTLNGKDYFGDDYSVSQPLSAYSDAVGTISPITDVDVFAYTAAKDGLYVFETYGNTDTYASLYSQANTTTAIATDDNIGDGNNFRLSATLVAGQTYYLYVRGREVGEYSLKALYAIGNIYGTVSPVKYFDYEPEFNEAIEGKVTLTTFDTNEFVATMHLKEWSQASSTNAAFDMTGIHGGTYLVSITRPGYLTRYRKILLNDNRIDLGSVALHAGDVNGDGVVNTADSTLLQSLYNKQYGQVGYNINADLNGDKIINASDLALLTPNLGKNANVYGELTVNVISVTASLSGSTLNISGTAAASSAISVDVFRGNINVDSTDLTTDASGAYTVTCNLSVLGTYTVIVSAENRAFDATAAIVYN